MTSERRLEIHVPSEWDVLLSPELAPLFVLDTALLAALRVFSVCLDPTSSEPGGTEHSPTRALLTAMHTLHFHIREHRWTAEAFHDDAGGAIDPADDVAEAYDDSLF